MPIGRNIVELVEAIPDRIEVSGTEPTWRVTGGSFDSVVAWVSDAFDEPVVIGREDHRRWWPRVTLTVTTDPALAAQAPALETFADPEPDPEPAEPAGPSREPRPEAQPQPEPRVEAPAPAPAVTVGRHRADPGPRIASADPQPELPTDGFTALEEIFASQEEARLARRFPEQRQRGSQTA
jgi:hypothetical protein